MKLPFELLNIEELRRLGDEIAMTLEQDEQWNNVRVHGSVEYGETGENDRLSITLKVVCTTPRGHTLRAAAVWTYEPHGAGNKSVFRAKCKAKLVSTLATKLGRNSGLLPNDH